ncbi:hypothetical protein Cal7507_5852 [Calothrix sp. PCC 7507]|nr:hypothetical protein Cal7507_5852 [Calothrix sp. PCC 7507]
MIQTSPEEELREMKQAIGSSPLPLFQPLAWHLKV